MAGECLTLWVVLFHNVIVFLVSLCAQTFTTSFVNSVQDITLPMNPKATSELQRIMLPPMENMQLFVFSFDALVAFYYLTTLPAFDWIRRKVPIWQQETKLVDKPDCSSWLLNSLFVSMSKGIPLGIVIWTQQLAIQSIYKLESDYQDEKLNQSAIRNLVQQLQVLEISLNCNTMLLGLMLFSYLMNFCILGKDMRRSVCAKPKAH